MAQEGVKKEGYLNKLPVKGLVKKWHRRWFVLYGTTHEGVVRLEYYDSEECAKSEVGKRTIPLRESTAPASAVGNKINPYVFQLKTQIGHHMLAADSHPELDDWMANIHQAVQEDKLRRKRKKSQSKVMASNSTDSVSFSDSGMSYKNRVDSGTYRVTVEENETSIKMNLSGTYSLELTPSKLTLKSTTSGATIFTFSYKFLKNYGKQSGQFHFETGKYAPIGEGKLIFVTTCSKEIFGVVHNNIKRLRESMQQTNPPRKLSQPQDNKQQQQQQQHQETQSVSVPAPLPPPPFQGSAAQKKQQILGTSNRPGSRHSGEIVNSSVVGTYRSSKDMEDQQDPSQEPQYAAVDYSKKTSKSKKKEELMGRKKAEQNGKQEEAIYSDPYESDPAYRAPPVPGHVQKVHDVRDSRASCALVELEENAFFDSFDEDDGEDDNAGNLEPLIEGASNPLDDFTDFSAGEFSGEQGAGASASATSPATKPQGNDISVTDLLNELEVEANKFDTLTTPGGYAGGGGAAGGGAEASTKQPSAAENMMNFDFDFAGAFVPGGKEDPFSAGLGAGQTADLAEFDLSRLDANFFEKLEAIEAPDQPPTSTNNAWGNAWPNMKS